MITQPISKRLLALFSLALACCLLAAAPAPAQEVVLFNGKDLSGWHLRNNNAETKNTWKVVSDVKLDASDPKKLVGTGEGGSADSALFRQPVAHGSDIISDKEFGDCELHIEFMVPKSSNSGVYLMGRYEIQVLDSFGKKGKLSPGDCGGIYSTQAPSTNASKAPGEWQTFDVVFRAPRFDASGKKTENAKFVSLKLNGTTIQENVEVKGGTGGQISNKESPTGPIMLQGDHGIVAFRNIRVKPAQ